MESLETMLFSEILHGCRVPLSLFTECADCVKLQLWLTQYKFIVLSDIYNTLYCDGDTICYVLTIPLSTSAPPLTVENVLKYLPAVKNWREVGLRLLGYNEAKVQAIEQEYSSNDDRMRAAVQQWLQGEDLSPSWRTLVWALDRAGDIQVADPIRGFTEPPRGESS